MPLKTPSGLPRRGDGPAPRVPRVQHQGLVVVLVIIERVMASYELQVEDTVWTAKKRRWSRLQDAERLLNRTVVLIIIERVASYVL
jgi:hypothetical protein